MTPIYDIVIPSSTVLNDIEKTVFGLNLDVLYGFISPRIDTKIRNQYIVKADLFDLYGEEKFRRDVTDILNSNKHTIYRYLKLIGEDKCWCCSREGEYKRYIDHIVAICNGGGGSWLNNYQILCESCHHEKTKKDFAINRKEKAIPKKKMVAVSIRIPESLYNSIKEKADKDNRTVPNWIYLNMIKRTH